MIAFLSVSLAWWLQLDSITKATWIIALAAIVNVYVYWRISRQTRKQISLTEKEAELTRELFEQANRPRLSVVIDSCTLSVQSPSAVRIEGEMMVTNLGTITAANLSIDLRLATDTRVWFHQRFGPLMLHPQEPHRESISSDIGNLPARRLKATITCSYTGTGEHKTGIGERTYTYKDEQSYDPDKGRFFSRSSSGD
jgi:hypothetical protein